MLKDSQKDGLMDSLKKYYPDAEATKKIILNCALVAAAADAAGSIIPGVAVIAVITSCFGAIWVMYGKLCSALNITLKKNTLKLLARAAISNIIVNIGSAIIAFVASLLIPGASIVISAMIIFVSVYCAGYLFLNMISKLAIKSRDPNAFTDISVVEMKKCIKEQKLTKEDLEDATNVFRENRSDAKDIL